MGFFDAIGKAVRSYEQKVSREIDKRERSGEVSAEQASSARERLSRSVAASEKIGSSFSSVGNSISSFSSGGTSDSEFGGKTVDEWDREWKSIGMLKTADLSSYNNCVGLYRHVVNGVTKYVGRAIEYNNGGFRKRLSDYRRDSNSARKHTSGRIIYENLDKIETYILIVGKDHRSADITKELEPEFIKRYDPEWNKMLK